MVQIGSPALPVERYSQMKKKKKEIGIIFKLLGQITLSILGLFLFIMLLRGSNSWCDYTDVFDIVSINIKGNRILSRNEILKMANIDSDSSIKSLDLADIQTKLEINPYIKAASVSREYPNRINILICERVPICYINHKGLLLVDAEGIVLPVPEQSLDTNLPVISGFESDSLDYYPGYYIPNDEVLKIVQIMDATLTSAPELYSEISEIHYWNHSSYILYTIKNGTPIYLGEKSLPEQLSILANFQDRLNGKRHLSDYQYLDLRWNKQIVVRERRS